MSPSIIMTLLKSMGFDPEVFVPQVKSALQKVEQFDAKLNIILNHIQQKENDK